MHCLLDNSRQTMGYAFLLGALMAGCGGDNCPTLEIEAHVPLEAAASPVLPPLLIENLLPPPRGNPNLTANDIRRFAEEHLKVGMATSEACRELAKCGLILTIGGSSGGTTTQCYNNGDNYGPSLSLYSTAPGWVGTNRLTDQVTGWDIEEARPRPSTTTGLIGEFHIDPEAIVREFGGDGPRKADKIRQIANDVLQVGMEISEARAAVTRCGLYRTVDLGSNGGENYGTDDIHGPKLAIYVSFENQVARWEVSEGQ